MLTHLSIRDVVLIEKLDLPLHKGLTALTGETGAGKSILLDSLGLALGKRTHSRIIRSGARQSSVTAVFDLSIQHPVYALLKEMDILSIEEGDPIVLRRIITQEGRSRAYICDQPLSITALRRIAELLVEIQGQHEQMGLADERSHRELLDNFGVPKSHVHLVSQKWDQWQNTRKKLHTLHTNIEEARREEEWLRATVNDLSILAPQENEEEELASLRIKLQQDERRGEAVAAALSELTPRDRRSTAPAQALRAASRALGRLLPSPLNPEKDAEEPNEHQYSAQEALNALDKAEESLAEAETLLSRLAADTSVDNRLLEDTEERLFALRAEARKHHITVSELPHFLQTLKNRLAHIECSNDEILLLEENLKKHRLEYTKAAQTLTQSRQRAAHDLQNKVMHELKPLKLDRAHFITNITPLPDHEWNQSGTEKISFLIAANPGQPPGPLGKVASGGELSRLMLAMKVVLASRSSLTTLVFDEVDSGVGGATASAIGERLHRVAQNVQVLAITHSPQVAARGDQQLRISKRVSQNHTQTTAEPLSHSERREEIARMLAGNTITDAARAAADSLLGSSH